MFVLEKLVCDLFCFDSEVCKVFSGGFFECVCVDGFVGVKDNCIGMFKLLSYVIVFMLFEQYYLWGDVLRGIFEVNKVVFRKNNNDNNWNVVVSLIILMCVKVEFMSIVDKVCWF